MNEVYVKNKAAFKTINAALKKLAADVMSEPIPEKIRVLIQKKRMKEQQEE